MGQSNLRKGRYSQPGQIYSITFTTFQRQQSFGFESGREFLKLIHDPSIKRDHKYLCFCVMPDHVHLLLELGEFQSLSKFMQILKGETSRKMSRAGDGAFWDKGFHDRAIRKEEDLKDIARYIVNNPVRAGLVKSVRQYPLWDAVWI